MTTPVQHGVGGSGRGWGWKGKRGRSKSPGKWRSSKMYTKYVTKAQLAKKVMAIVNKKAETKHHFHEFKSSTADQACTVYHMTSINDGVQAGERIAENIMVTGIDVGGYFNSDEGTEAVLARLIVFRANESLSATPSAASVLATVNDARAPVSLYAVDNVDIGPGGSNRTKSIFSIYYDKTFAIADENGGFSKIPFRVNIRLPTPLPCNFVGETSGDEGAGQWYMLWCSTIASGTTTCQLNADARVYYTDV